MAAVDAPPAFFTITGRVGWDSVPGDVAILWSDTEEYQFFKYGGGVVEGYVFTADLPGPPPPDALKYHPEFYENMGMALVAVYALGQAPQDGEVVGRATGIAEGALAISLDHGVTWLNDTLEYQCFECTNFGGPFRTDPIACGEVAIEIGDNGECSW